MTDVYTFDNTGIQNKKIFKRGLKSLFIDEVFSTDYITREIIDNYFYIEYSHQSKNPPNPLIVHVVSSKKVEGSGGLTVTQYTHTVKVCHTVTEKPLQFFDGIFEYTPPKSPDDRNVSFTLSWKFDNGRYVNIRNVKDANTSENYIWVKLYDDSVTTSSRFWFKTITHTLRIHTLKDTIRSNQSGTYTSNGTLVKYGNGENAPFLGGKRRRYRKSRKPRHNKTRHTKTHRNKRR